MQPYRLIDTPRDFLSGQLIDHLRHDKSFTANPANHSILSTEVLFAQSHPRFILHMPEIAKSTQPRCDWVSGSPNVQMATKHRKLLRGQNAALRRVVPRATLGQ
jgi:hypothetical protein